MVRAFVFTAVNPMGSTSMEFLEAFVLAPEMSEKMWRSDFFASSSNCILSIMALQKEQSSGSHDFVAPFPEKHFPCLKHGCGNAAVLKVWHVVQDAEISWSSIFTLWVPETPEKEAYNSFRVIKGNLR